MKNKKVEKNYNYTYNIYFKEDTSTEIRDYNSDLIYSHGVDTLLDAEGETYLFNSIVDTPSILFPLIKPHIMNYRNLQSIYLKLKIVDKEGRNIIPLSKNCTREKYVGNSVSDGTPILRWIILWNALSSTKHAYPSYILESLDDSTKAIYYSVLANIQTLMDKIEKKIISSPGVDPLVLTK